MKKRPLSMMETMDRINAFFHLLILERAYALKLDVVVEWLAKILRRFTK